MTAAAIGLTGPAGSGKSTVAAAIEAAARAEGREVLRLHVGAPLKAMLAALYAAAGLTPEEAARRIDGDLKRRPCTILGGRTPTEAQQTLGTEWGRRLISPDLWLSIWIDRAAAVVARGGIVINESVRFDNEAVALRSLGGRVVRLTGRAGDLSGAAAGHASEAGVAADAEVSNAGPPEDAARAILAMLRA